mgnify:CR=1 FL=1
MQAEVRRRSRYGGLCGLAAIAVCMPMVARGQEEIAPFRLTGIEGNVALRYTSDGLFTQSNGSGKTHEVRSSFEEEVYLLTHSYVYHPNFLKIDLGGGPLLVQNRLKTDGGDNRSSNTLYNLTGRFSFLEQKPYPFAFYYEHLNPSVSLGVADRFLQTSTKVGANASLLQPLSPVSLNLDAFRQESEGKGFGVVQNDTNEQATLRAYRAIGDSGYGQFVYQTNHRESRSGSPNLPIQVSTNDNHEMAFDSRHLFGERRQFHLTQLTSYSTQEYVIVGAPFTSYRDFRFSPDLRWEHDPDRNSFYRYSLFTSHQGVQKTTNQSATAGMTQRWEQRLAATGDIHAENNQTTGVDQDAHGVAGSLSYQRPLSFGNLQLSYGLRHDDRERKAIVSQIAVLGEHINLPDSIAVTLVGDFIVAATVTVSNVGRTQTYVLNVDYELVTIGNKTSVRRLIGGAILDGQEVLVDYSYQAGGSFRYIAQDQTLEANLTIKRYYNIYAGYRDAPQRLVSGLPTLPLNSVRNTHYGARAGLPVYDFVEVGGEARHDRQHEDIAPFRRDSYDAYAQFPVPRIHSATLRMSGRHVIADNIGSPEDVNARGWTLRLQARPWSHSVLSAERSYDEDTGGTVPRRNWATVVQAEWRIRQLTLRAEGRQSREEQGGFIRERTLVRALARRDF